MEKNIPDDSIVVRNARSSVKNELEKKRLFHQPISRFDAKTGKIYRENADGTITPVGEAMKRGRYSERCREKA